MQAPVTPVIKLSSPATKDFWEIPVLYEDETLLAIEKPSKLLVSPDRYDIMRPNIMRLFHRDVAKPATWVQQRNLTYVANAHRLDFETSGVLLLAKTKPALVSLADQFGSELAKKTYLALVSGGPIDDQFETSSKLGMHPVQVGLVRVDPKNGKKSHTAFEVIERFKGYTYLRCKPTPGRTHQIRVHLQNLGLPILGDELYGGHPLMLSTLKQNYRLKRGRTEHPLIGRVALHAHELTVKHPVTGVDVTITSPLPHDMEVALKFLRRHAL
jgi:RluA family pseudouridine synthase